MSNSGVLQHGGYAARIVSQRVLGAFASTTALAALPADHRIDGAIAVVTTGPTLYIFDGTSTATASATVLAPASGSGRWKVGGGSGGSNGKVAAVRVSTAAALPAYARVANVITATAVGAMAAVDGVTLVAGDLLLLQHGAAGADDGIYVVDNAGGGAAKFVLTRAVGFDDSTDFASSPIMVMVSEGTAHADTQWVLTTNAAITLNTTPLIFVQIPDLTDLASVATGEGASLIGIEDADGVFAGATGEAVLTEIGTAAVASATPVHNVICASTANIAALAATPETQDGVTMIAGDRILLKDQAAGEENGIYVMGTIGGGVGPLTRATDFDNAANVRTGCLVSVSEGTASADTLWRLTTNAPITVGATALAFAEVWTAARGLATAGAASGAIADAGALLAGATIEAALDEIASDSVWGVSAVHEVRAASVANIAALATTAELQDGVTLVQGDRILLLAQAAGEENGVYEMGVIGVGVGPLTRVGDNDTALNLVTGSLYSVSEGTANADTIWRLTTNAPIVVGATPLVFAEVWTAARGLAVAGAAQGAIADVGAIITAANIEDACQEFAADIDTISCGTPMVNRLTMLGAPGAIVAGNTVTIGADTYEFNSNSPPDVAGGGTGGFIWVYQGAASVNSRANFIDAVNGVVNAATVTRGDGIGANAGTNTEFMLAAAGTALGDVDLHSADAIGGTIAASGVATATTVILATGTDIWDDPTMYGGAAQAAAQMAMSTTTLAAAHITKGTLEITFDFTPRSVIVVNRMRPQTEAYVIGGDVVTLTLGGGGAPANQAADVIDMIAFG